MQVQEKTRHIDATITGSGLDEIVNLILKNIPGVVITNDNAEEDDDEYVRWEDTDLCKEIRMYKTPGRVLHAYREREGLSLGELAKRTKIKYTNISAMEHDSRVIGVSVAKRLASVLRFDYTRLLV